VNRTEALDASRAAIREKLTTLPRRDPLVETLAQHMTADAKKLEEDEETGARRYRYFKTRYTQRSGLPTAMSQRSPP